jgi:hypothetical protein
MGSAELESLKKKDLVSNGKPGLANSYENVRNNIIEQSILTRTSATANGGNRLSGLTKKKVESFSLEKFTLNLAQTEYQTTVVQMKNTGNVRFNLSQN